MCEAEAQASGNRGEKRTPSVKRRSIPVLYATVVQIRPTARPRVESIAEPIRYVRESSNDSNPWSQLLIRLVVRISVLAGRPWASRVFDELALALQPLSLGRLGVALIILGGSPADPDHDRPRGWGGVTRSAIGIRPLRLASTPTPFATRNCGSKGPARHGR
jgi:hypothetical protein